MKFDSYVHLSIVCQALTSVATVVGCQDGRISSHYADSSYSLSKIQSRTLSLQKKNRSSPCIGNAGYFKLRGGAADDRPVYDERPRRRPLPPPQYNENGGRRVQGSPRDFDDHRQYDRIYHDERKLRRHDGKAQNRTPERYVRTGVNSSVTEEKKGWFGSKKKAHIGKDLERQKPPPPPPPPNTFSNYNPAETERVPINYMFPATEVAASERQPIDDKATDFDPIGGPNLPIKAIDDERRELSEQSQRRRGNDDRYASPRRDAVTMYMSTRFGTVKVRLGSIVVGAALGSFIGKVRSERTTSFLPLLMHQKLKY